MKILIIKPSSLGDVIHSLPFLKAVTDTFQDAHIEWVISKNLKKILEGHPLINKLIVFDKDSWKNIKSLPKAIKGAVDLIKTLRAERYDIVIDLQGLLRSGFITFFAMSPLKIGFKHAREGSRLFYNKKIPVNGALHAVDKYLEIAKNIGAKIEKVEFPLYIDDLARKRIKNLIGDISEYIVIAPSARWETKRWPPEKFGMLVSRLPIPCVITGSNADRGIAQKVIDLSLGKTLIPPTPPSVSSRFDFSKGGKGGFSGNIINLCGKTGLKELTAIIAGAKAVVSNDSGPMHIATALGVPVIAFFGPTDPKKTGPYRWQTNKALKVLRNALECSPCFKKRCKDPLCMSGISVETVLEEIKEYL